MAISPICRITHLHFHVPHWALWNSWTFGPTPEMRLSSPFVKAILETFPFSLSSSSRGLSRSEGTSGIPAGVPSEHLQVSWSGWIPSAACFVWRMHPWCSFYVPQPGLFPDVRVAHPTVLMEQTPALHCYFQPYTVAIQLLSERSSPY